MNKVTEILTRKQGDVLTIDGKSTVLEAIRAMVERNVGSILVTEGEAIRGIFTERDYMRRIALEGRSSGTTRVEEVMKAEMICVDTDRDVEECMAIMTQKRIRHLPVLKEGRLAGIISIGDVVKFLSREREAEVRHLTDYIAGKYPG